MVLCELGTRFCFPWPYWVSLTGVRPVRAFCQGFLWCGGGTGVLDGVCEFLALTFRVAGRFSATLLALSTIAGAGSAVVLSMGCGHAPDLSGALGGIF